MDVHALFVEIPALDLIGIGHDGRQLGDQLDGLTQHVFHGDIVWVGIVCVQSGDGAAHLVHDVGGWRSHDHVCHEIKRQLPVQRQQGAEIVQLPLGGQHAEHQQIDQLFVAETVVRPAASHKIVQVDTAVIQTALLGDALAVVDIVTLNVAYLCQTDHHAGAVGIAEPSFDRKPIEIRCVDPVVRDELCRKFPKRAVVNEQ